MNPALGWMLFVVLVTAGPVLAWEGRRRRFLLESLRLHLWLFPAFTALLLLMMRLVQPEVRVETMNPAAGIPGFAILAALGVGATWTWYWSEVISHHLTHTFPQRWMGDHRIRRIASFDLGDAAVKAGKPEEAVRLYRAELEKKPDEPELYLRLANAYRVLKDPGQVAANLRHAARCARDAEQKGSVSILLAEELGKSGDPGGAQTVLQTLLRDPGLAKFHPAAKGRLQRPWN